MTLLSPLRQGTSALARAAFPRITKCSPAPLRAAFHSAPRQPQTFFTSRAPAAATAGRLANKISLRASFGIRGGARTYMQGGSSSQYTYNQEQVTRNNVKKILTGAAIFGGTLVAINVVFNRETREGAMPAYERSYLNDTFLHTGLGVGIIGLTARQLVSSGFVYRIMVTNPWVFAIGGMALSFGTMIATRSIDPDNYIPKYACWTAFNATQAAFVAPLLVMAPGALIARAGLYTVAMMGGLAVVGATAKEDKYLYIGGPLLAGACVIAASGLAPLILPATAARSLAFSQNIWLYGGLVLFGGFTLYDVQKVMHHARLAQRGIIKRDPVNESISLELDFLNIFVRMVQILMMQNRKK
ncbi:related to growth hormone inducible transmembrane protein [Cephalotrichum gorgonifer]|uniref:Related to growth hormone inducible transmembrane protein n=1 Tax=Cephalotrichum gorgonifer TaxID=2041049 RepID=A0AAE8N0D0_9PEZI|nr:related to growth hormone inducible transmembrane protein [Cephalotrichum gorgonifer]